MRTIRIRAEPYTEPSHSDVVSGRDCFGETLCSYNSNEQFHIRAGEFHSVLCPVKYQLWWLLSFFLLVCSTSACTFCLFCEVVHCDKQLLLVPFRWFIIKMRLFFFLPGCSSLICTFSYSFQVVHHQQCTLSYSFQVCSSLTCAFLSGYSLSTCDLCLRLSILQLLGCELLGLLDFLLHISSLSSYHKQCPVASLWLVHTHYKQNRMYGKSFCIHTLILQQQ